MESLFTRKSLFVLVFVLVSLLPLVREASPVGANGTIPPNGTIPVPISWFPLIIRNANPTDGTIPQRIRVYFPAIYQSLSLPAGR